MRALWALGSCSAVIRKSRGRQGPGGCESCTGARKLPFSPGQQSLHLPRLQSGVGPISAADPYTPHLAGPTHWVFLGVRGGCPTVGRSRAHPSLSALPRPHSGYSGSERTIPKPSLHPLLQQCPLPSPHNCLPHCPLCPQGQGLPMRGAEAGRRHPQSPRDQLIPKSLLVLIQVFLPLVPRRCCVWGAGL